MLCSNCEKLSYQYTQKTCLRCQGQVLKSIASICEFCSKTDKQCASCLKRVLNPVTKKTRAGGCGSCSK